MGAWVSQTDSFLLRHSKDAAWFCFDYSSKIPADLNWARTWPIVKIPSVFNRSNTDILMFLNVYITYSFSELEPVDAVLTCIGLDDMAGQLLARCFNVYP